MKHIRAVVLDLDGTLLTSHKTVSPRTEEALLNLQKSGCAVIIATARPPRAVKNVLPADFLSTHYVIYYNGALIVNEKTGYREHRPLASHVVCTVLDEVHEAKGGCFLSVECEDQWFCFEELQDEDRAMFRLQPGQEPIIAERKSVESRAVTKVLFRHAEHVRHIPAKLRDRGTTLITDRDTLVQVSALEATKEAAVAQVLQLLHIQPADTMVFGDDYNDLGLFGFCGYPIAMGNAVPELKQMAKKVTLSNDEDGVAVVIEEMLQAKNS